MSALSSVGSGLKRIVVPIDRVLLAALAVVAICPFGRLFATDRYLLWSIGAVVLVMLSTAWLVPKRPFIVSFLVSVLLLVLYEVFVVFAVGAPTPSALHDVWSGVTGSWDGLLSVPLPAESRADLVSLPVVLAWGAAVLSLELAGRTRVVVATVVPSVAAFATALLFAGRRTDGFPTLALLMAAGVLGTVLLRANAIARAPGTSAAQQNEVAAERGGTGVPLYLRLGLPVLAVVVIGAVAIADRLPFTKDDQRFELRDQYQAQVDLTDAVSPLARVRAGLNDEADPVLFRVKLGGDVKDADVTRIRVATLEDFDGAVWGTQAQFTEVGSELPTPAAVELAEPDDDTAARVTQHYEIEDNFRGSFLPSIERPVTLEGDDLGYDREAGMVVRDGPTGSSFSYDVTSEVPTPPIEEFEDATAAVDPRWSELASLPGAAGTPGPPVPTEISQYASKPEFSLATPFLSLQAIDADMRGTQFGYSTEATPGHSYGVLKSFLGAQTGSGADSTGRVGYSEQFAAAFATVARLRGLPSRVVVGYIVTPEDAASGREFEVSAKDIHAWAEVHFRGVGWAVFDPTNREEREPEPPPPTSAPPTTAPPTSSPTSAPVSSVVPTSAPTQCTGANCKGDGPGIALWPFLVAAVVIAIPLGIVALKRVRRTRRRTKGTPAQRVIGAWRETKDRLRTHGVRSSRAMTVTELAETCAPTAGEETGARLAEMAPVIDNALYAEEDPSDEMVEAAWNSEAGVADALKERSGVFTRLRAAVDPRPLVGGRK